jgi:ABC-type sugar transport system substrate-binding protein
MRRTLALPLRLALLLAMLVLAAGLVACGDDDDDDGGGGGSGGSEQSDSGGSGSVQGNGEEIVMFTMTSSNVYGANQIAGAKEEAEALGYELKVYENTFSQPEQDQQVQQYIASGAKPAAIIWWPWIRDAGLNSVRQLAQLAPVVQMTQPPDDKSWPYVKAYSGANQTLIGETLGQMMIEAREAAREAGAKFKSENGSLLVFQHPEGEFTGTARFAAFEDVTADEPFEVIHTEYGANDPETGYEKGSQIIPRFKGKFDFLFISNQQAANGIIRALKENGITPGKDVWLVSGDCSGSLEAVKNGETFGTGIQPAAVEGRLAVRTAAKLVANDGKTEGEETQYEVEAAAPEVDAAPPAKYNFMPHAPAVGAEGIANTEIWGLSADEICAGG